MKKLKIAVLILLIVVTAGTLLLFGIMAYRNNRYAANWDQAEKDFKEGRLDTAREQLFELIRQDPSSEKAYRLLAEIAERQHHYTKAAALWKHVAALNPLDKSLRARQAETLLNGRQYQAVELLLLSDFENGKLSAPELLPFAEAMVISGTPGRAESAVQQLTAAKIAPERSEFIRGLLLLRQGKADEAHKIFLKCAAPDQAPEVRWRAEIALAGYELGKGNLKAAESAYRVAESLIPERTFVLLADFYRASGQKTESMAYLRKELKLNPENRAALVDLSEHLASDKELKEVEKLRGELKPNGKYDLETAYYLDALIAFTKGNFEQAFNNLSLAPLYADRTLYRLMRIGSAIETGKVEKLRDDYAALINPATSPERRQRLTEPLAALLLKLNAANRGEDTATVAGLILDFSPADAPDRQLALQVAMADAFLRRDFLSARKYAELRLKAVPDDQGALTIMGDSLLTTGNARKSLDYFAKAKPDARVLFGQARALEALGKNGEAAESLQKAWELSPDDLPLLQEYFAFLLRSKNSQAAQKLAASLPEKPEYDYAKNDALGKFATAAGKTQEARKHYDKAIAALDKLPETPASRYQKGYLYAITDRNREAQAIYQELLKKDPNSGMLLVNLSEVEAALGNDVAALDLAKRAIRLYPTWEIARQCLDNRMKERPAENE